MEAAGVALAVVGLAGQCFSGAIKALHLLSTARNMRSDYQYLTVRIHLDLQRLFNWADSAGLVAFIQDEEQTSGLDSNLTGVNRSVILEVLSQLEELAVRFIKHKKRYSDLFTPVESGAELSEGKSTIKPKEQYQDDKFQYIESFLVSAWTSAKALDLPRKIRWTAMDKDRYEDLTTRVKLLIDSLLGLVNDSTSKATYALTKETNKSVLQLHDKVEDLAVLIQALTISPSQSLVSSQSHASILRASSGMAQDEETTFLLELARFKILNRVVESGSAVDIQSVQGLQLPSYTENKLDFQNVALTRESVKIARTPGLESMGLDRGSYTSDKNSVDRVYIEWKPYKHVNAKFEPHADIRLRVEKLTTLLKGREKPASFRIPNYLGYFLDSEGDRDEDEDDGQSFSGSRFGLVFSMPELGGVHTNIQTLKSLLNPSTFPSLTSRISIAQKIALSLVSLHSVDWLHKGIRSSAVIFPTSQIEGQEVANLQEPFICGFEYSRPATKGERTEAPPSMGDSRLYRHPDAFDLDASSGQSFRMSFDIYSLGIVLLEIVCWRSVASILDIEHPDRASPHYVHKRLLENSRVSDMLGAAAGDTIRDAVMTCLRAPKSLLEDERLDETSDAALAAAEVSDHATETGAGGAAAVESRPPFVQFQGDLAIKSNYAFIPHTPPTYLDVSLQHSSTQVDAHSNNIKEVPRQCVFFSNNVAFLLTVADCAVGGWLAALVFACQHSANVAAAMRFRAAIHNTNTFTKFIASLSSIGPLAWVRLTSDDARFTVVPEMRGSQVWSNLTIDTVFDDYSVESGHPNNAVNFELPLAPFLRALRTATNASSVNIRLTKKDDRAHLALTIITTGTGSVPITRQRGHANGHNAAGDYHDDSDMQQSNSFASGAGVSTARERETKIQQWVAVKMLAESAVAGLHEPHCREPEVHIALPSLLHLKAISDRFTKLATASDSGRGYGSRNSRGDKPPRLYLSANMHGGLRIEVETEGMQVRSEWKDLENPALDPAQHGGEDGLAAHPSTLMRQKHGEDGWAGVRIDGRDWGRVLGVGRLGGRVIACFCHEHALILYVFLPNDETGAEESCLTYYVSSYSA